MSELRIARRYARALLGAAVESEILGEVESDVRGLYELILSSQDLASFLQDPTVWPRAKVEFLDNLLKGKVHGVTLDFLLMTVTKGRSAFLEDVLAKFGEILDEYRGEMAAQVRSAFELSAEQESNLKGRLSEYSEIKMVLTIRSGCLGGCGINPSRKSILYIKCNIEWCTSSSAAMKKLYSFIYK